MDLLLLDLMQVIYMYMAKRIFIKNVLLFMSLFVYTIRKGLNIIKRPEEGAART